MEINRIIINLSTCCLHLTRDNSGMKLQNDSGSHWLKIGGLAIPGLFWDDHLDFFLPFIFCLWIKKMIKNVNVENNAVYFGIIDKPAFWKVNAYLWTWVGKESQWALACWWCGAVDRRNQSVANEASCLHKQRESVNSTKSVSKFGRKTKKLSVGIAMFTNFGNSKIDIN